jgi:hypothetical protein
MPKTERWSSNMLSTDKNEAELRSLGVPPGSLAGRTFMSICGDGMATQADRIQELGYYLMASVSRVNATFEAGDIESVRLNELGELQARATEYDAAIAAYSALAQQRESFVARAQREQALQMGLSSVRGERLSERIMRETTSAPEVGRPGPRTKARAAQARRTDQENKHDYLPTKRVGNPCERCGNGRHHPWHN